MKNIICLLNENLSHEKKQVFLLGLKKCIADLRLPFSIDLYLKDREYDFEKYHYAILASPPKNILPKLSALEFVLSANAGVDDFIGELKNNKISVGRIVHQPAFSRISEYVLYCVLDYTLLMDKYRKQQAASHWNRVEPYRISQENIGILGLGNAGSQIANLLMKTGKKIIGYSRKAKISSPKFLIFNDLDIFLSQTNILINALPLTAQTAGILNKRTLGLLPEQSCLINIGRGAHIIENDLLEALETNKLSKAYLDVFELEPLPEKHIFWHHPKIFMTPHVAGVFDLMSILDEIISQCKTFYEKAIVINPIDRQDLNLL